ncbi:MAG: sigma-70 family RNA polymerase sigma factor [Deltaproteobacteria bacterium]|nr:sigma-70 family RNA polymerase sigma factor [Deltaproteobacteria bacterium]
MRDCARSVAAALAGRREGFRELFDRYRPAVERVAAAFAELQEGEARDLVIEAFARAFGLLGRLKEPARFGAWVLALTRQRCRSRLARRRDAEAIGADLIAPANVDLSPDPGCAALDFAALIAGQPEGAEREVPRLFYGEGRLTASAIAERLRLSPEVTTRHLEALRARVKSRLASGLLRRRAEGAPGPGPVHLDAEAWGHLMRGSRFPGEAALAAHLSAGCPACERFLVRLQGVDGLDGEVDSALVAVAPLRPARNDSEFELAMRRLHLDLRVSGLAMADVGRHRPSKALPLALAGALAFAGLGVLTLQRLPRREHRASPGPPEVALSFSVVSRGMARDTGEQGRAGATYQEQRLVFLRYDVSVPAFVTLLRLGPMGRAEVLSQQGRVGSGTHALRVNGEPVGVSLHGFVGRNRFIAVASDAPLSAESLRALLSAIPESGARASSTLDGAGVAVFEIEVAPAD